MNKYKTCCDDIPFNQNIYSIVTNPSLLSFFFFFSQYYNLLCSLKYENIFFFCCKFGFGVVVVLQFKNQFLLLFIIFTFAFVIVPNI